MQGEYLVLRRAYLIQVYFLPTPTHSINIFINTSCMYYRINCNNINFTFLQLWVMITKKKTMKINN